MRTDGYSRSISATDLSADALSTTQTSNGWLVCWRASASRQERSRRSPFQLTMTTVARGDSGTEVLDTSRHHVDLVARVEPLQQLVVGAAQLAQLLLRLLQPS